jgi:hypothetical protein
MGKLDHLIAEAGEKAQRLSLADEVYLRERQALDEQIPALWDKFRAAVKVTCEARAAHLHFCVAPNTQIRVDRKQDSYHRRVEIRFLRKSGVIAFDSGNVSGFCTFRLNRQNLAVICDQDGVQFPSLEDAVEEVLSLLFSAS